LSELLKILIEARDRLFAASIETGSCPTEEEEAFLRQIERFIARERARNDPD